MTSNDSTVLRHVFSLGEYDSEGDLLIDVGLWIKEHGVFTHDITYSSDGYDTYVVVYYENDSCVEEPIEDEPKYIRLTGWGVRFVKREDAQLIRKLVGHTFRCDVHSAVDGATRWACPECLKEEYELSHLYLQRLKELDPDAEQFQRECLEKVLHCD